MLKLPSKRQSLSQFMLRRVGILVLVTTLLVAGSFVVFGLQPMAARSASDQFEMAAARVEAGLSQTFTLPTQLLAMGHAWLGGQAPDLSSPTAFNQIFKPVLAQVPQITSVVAGTSTGQGWLLLQLDAGAWRNRMTDIARWGTQKHDLIEQQSGGSVQRSWGTQNYDPRQRLWYRAAMSSAGPNTVHWTPPYTFFTTGEPGITVSSRSRLLDGRDFVLGFDLKLRDLSRTTLDAKIGAQGLALVLTDDERVLALPRAPSTVAVSDWYQQVLKPVGVLALTPVDQALRAWRAQGSPPKLTLQFVSAGATWLMQVRPYRLGEQGFWVLVLAPQSDFAPSWQAIGQALVLALLLITALSLWLTYAGARRLVRPLQELVQASQRISELDFADPPVASSRVTEIGQLLASQARMRTVLRENQLELDARADELNHQVASLKATEERLQQQNDQLATILENFPGGISVVDGNLRVIAFNSRFKTLLNLPEELCARPDLQFADFIRFNAQRGEYGLGDVEQLVADRVAQAGKFEPHRFEREMPDGTVLEIRGVPLPQGGFVTVYLDVTANKRHQAELEQLAHFDLLTGLPNRVLLADRLHQAMAQVHRRGQKLVVAYLDLDGFKAINDCYGHDLGDQLLRTVASRMKQALRDVDTLARLGGDEFVAVLLDVAGLDDSLPMIQRLLAAAAAPVQLGVSQVHVSASVGLTFYPQPQEIEADQLLRQADQAMYRAKQAGKNNFHLFDAAQDRHVRVQLESVERLHSALLQGELVLYYQPKVNMRSAQVVGAEALIRWQHPEQGLLLPGRFLPLIEDHALAVLIGQWVITRTLRQMSHWQHSGLRLPVSVNVGARQLQQDGFVEFLAQALAEQGDVAAADLEIEVLETSALQDIARVTQIMHQCQALGVQFALDDFGTGYSSLTYLKRLPVASLKIDQSFVRDMLDDPDDLSILQGVLDLASSFHRQVIAEGVETVAHGRMLLQLGCELAQGFGVAHPMAAQEMPAWVASWHGEAHWQHVPVLPKADLALLFAIVEHRVWLDALQAYLRGTAAQAASLDLQRCQFGQWLDHAGARHDAAALAAVEALHTQLHRLAEQCCAIPCAEKAATLAQLPTLLSLREEFLAQLQALLSRPGVA